MIWLRLTLDDLRSSRRLRWIVAAVFVVAGVLAATVMTVTGAGTATDTATVVSPPPGAPGPTVTVPAGGCPSVRAELTAIFDAAPFERTDSLARQRAQDLVTAAQAVCPPETPEVQRFLVWAANSASGGPGRGLAGDEP